MKTKAKKAAKTKVEKPATKKSISPKKQKAMKNDKKPPKQAKPLKDVSIPEEVQLSGSSSIYETKAEHNGLPAGTQFKERTDQRWQAYDAEGKQLDVIMNRGDMEGNPNVFQQIK